MYRLILLFIILYFSAIAYAQEPQRWKFSSVKNTDSTFVIYFKCVLKSGWHIYSQQQSEKAIAIPTRFNFYPNPLVKSRGNVMESGKLIKWTDKVTGLMADQYADSVMFSVSILLKAKATTRLCGTIAFQTCTDEICLPSETIPFSVGVNQGGNF